MKLPIRGGILGIVCLLTMLTTYAQAPCSSTLAQEYQALMALYQSTNGANWTNKTGWSTADPGTVQSVQGWYGVTVDANGRVTDLNLSQNNLSGTLPVQLGNLCNLRLLYLHTNSLSGAIPSSIGNLSKLEMLIMFSNQFTSIPNEIGNLTALKQLNLSSNQLGGNIPPVIGGLINLEELNLAGNEFWGSIPVEICSLTHLRVLALHLNALSGSLPQSIGSLNALTHLYLHGNTLSGAIPTSVGSLSNLIALQLQSNQLTSIPDEIGNLTSLKQLYIYSNHLNGSIPSTIGKLASLEDLNLADNSLSGEIPSSIGSLTRLYILALHANSLSGPLPSTLGNLNTLTHLYLNNNLLSETVPLSLANIPGLIRLELHTNTLTAIPVEIGNVSTLQQLSAYNNQLTFSSIVPLKANYGGTFSYYGQANVDAEKNIAGPLGGSVTLTTTIDRNTNPASVYQWFKVVNGTTTQLNTASTDGHTVTIQNIAQADAGTQFYYKITNPSAPDLTLTSKIQTLQIVTCTTPILDFQFAEINGTHTFTPALTGENCTATYAWDFGDGTTSSEQTAVHSYLSTGTFNVKLTVSYSCNGCPAGELMKEHQVTIENGLCGSIYCDGIGGVGIGTRKTDGFRLSVNGKIRASDIIKVYPQGQWSDFVFEKDYRLPPLKEVELFINKNGHLPGIPSAKEVESAGIDLGAMDAKLLQKIEELTLYIIKMDEAMLKLNQRIQTLERENKELKKR